MSIQSQFTPEQIQALVSGQTVAFTSKSDAEVTPANEIKEDKGLEPASSVKPRTSVPITKVTAVSQPQIKDTKGSVVTEGAVSGPSPKAFTNLDQESARLKAEALAKQQAKAELELQANPAQLLNTLNGLRRIVEKQGKEIAALKKASKEAKE